LVQGLERTKRVTRRDTPSVYEVLVADINVLESKIIKAYCAFFEVISLQMYDHESSPNHLNK